MKLVPLIVVMCFFASCAIKKSQGSFSKEEGYLYYHHSAPAFGLRVYGDYFVHSVDSKYFRDVSKFFLRYSLSRIQNVKPQLAFAAHTIVQPYYSSICTIYKNTNLDSPFVQTLRNEMKSLLNVKTSSYEVVYTNYGSAIKLGYQVLHPVIKTYSTHTEYLVNDDGNVIRFCFWTVENNKDIVFPEAEGVIKNLRF